MLTRWLDRIRGDEKLPCVDCGAMILRATARENKGYCTPCARLGPKLRAGRAALNAAVADGRVYQPSAEERDGARDPATVVDISISWVLSAEVHREPSITTPEQALTALVDAGEGQVFLGTDATHHLILEAKTGRGVCTISNGFENTQEVRLYAYTSQNERAQVPGDEQLWAGCPCCGVGTVIHPSRAHMPIEQAVEIFRAAMAHDYSGAEWLDLQVDMFSSRGKG